MNQMNHNNNSKANVFFIIQDVNFEFDSESDEFETEEEDKGDEIGNLLMMYTKKNYYLFKALFKVFLK